MAGAAQQASILANHVVGLPFKGDASVWAGITVCEVIGLIPNHDQTLPLVSQAFGGMLGELADVTQG